MCIAIIAVVSEMMPERIELTSSSLNSHLSFLCRNCCCNHNGFDPEKSLKRPPVGFEPKTLNDWTAGMTHFCPLPTIKIKITL
uniref:Uncharacterized protein n=1 Tax=Magallana gigas TaxID=29159 RepID=K1Q029_MAGGI